MKLGKENADLLRESKFD